MTDMWTLKAMGVLDKFNARADEADPVIEAVLPGEVGQPVNVVLPLLQKHDSVYHAIFDLDFSKSKKHLCSEFSAWLDLPKNREQLERYKMPTIGTTGGPLDHLKALAMWRLYRELDNNWDKANDFAQKHRKESKPFHDARKGQSKTPLNHAQLASEESSYLKAKTRAKTYLAKFIPAEFDAPDACEGWEGMVSRSKKASKISKRSSLKP